MITLQSIFNGAYQAFVIEKRPPAYHPELGCRYLFKDGRKCGIGLALPDGHPVQEFHGTFPAMVTAYPELFDVGGVDDERLGQFQLRLHDGHCSSHEWRDGVDLEAEYRALAQEFGLVVPVSAPHTLSTTPPRSPS